MKTKYLLFVYNAESNLFSVVTDFVHKIVKPSTYNCSLCTLTYGNMSIKKEWSAFLERLDIEKEFLHKDEFIKKHNMEISYPAILLFDNNRFETIVSAEELNDLHSLEDLMQLLKTRLTELNIEMK